MNWKLNLAGGQRLLVNLKNIDVCPLLENLDSIPILLRHEVDFLNETFPGMVHKCPYTASDSFLTSAIFVRFSSQSVKCINASLKQQEEVKWQWFPSGVYKTMYKASDDSDGNIFTLILRNENVNNFQETEF
jgi:hypothetical protein